MKLNVFRKMFLSAPVGTKLKSKPESCYGYKRGIYVSLVFVNIYNLLTGP